MNIYDHIRETGRFLFPSHFTKEDETSYVNNESYNDWFDQETLKRAQIAIAHGNKDLANNLISRAYIGEDTEEVGVDWDLI